MWMVLILILLTYMGKAIVQAFFFFIQVTIRAKIEDHNVWINEWKGTWKRSVWILPTIKNRKMHFFNLLHLQKHNLLVPRPRIKLFLKKSMSKEKKKRKEQVPFEARKKYVDNEAFNISIYWSTCYSNKEGTLETIFEVKLKVAESSLYFSVQQRAFQYSQIV